METWADFALLLSLGSAGGEYVGGNGQHGTISAPRLLFGATDGEHGSCAERDVYWDLLQGLFCNLSR